ncbi:unnamed protein product, partial [Allacma fusca]
MKSKKNSICQKKLTKNVKPLEDRSVRDTAAENELLAVKTGEAT